MRSVYFVGAHRTGKTTLCKWASQQWNLPQINEVATTVLNEMALTLDQIRVDPKLAADFQKTIFKRQLAAERAFGKEPYCSDRAFDNLAYAAEHTAALPDILASVELKSYIDHVKGGVIFFTRPHPSLMVKDKVNVNVDWEEINRIDGMCKFMMKMWGIQYIPISSPSFDERTNTVSSVLNYLT